MNVIITSHRISIILFSDITETWNVISMNKLLQATVDYI